MSRLLCVAMLLLVGACGQKGPLYFAPSATAEAAGELPTEERDPEGEIDGEPGSTLGTGGSDHHSESP